MSAKPLRTIVVDDEPLARDELVFLLQECGGVEIVGEAQDCNEALTLCDEVGPELCFVDLRMPGRDGITLAEALASRYQDTRVVIVSAHDDGALRAFEAQVLDYLLKPVRLERLKSCVQRAQATFARTKEPTAAPLKRLAVRRRNSYIVLDIDDVIYFEAKDELVWAVTREDRFALDLTLTALEQSLPSETFFRSHRCVLVKLDHIRAIEPMGGGTFELLLNHPAIPRVPLARERARVLRERIPFTG